MTTEEKTQSVRDVIGAAIGRIPSGCFIVTAKSSGRHVGMLASWVMQAGFEPPSVALAVHPDRELYSVIEEADKFSINVMGKNNLNLMKVFSKYTPDQFDQVPNKETEYGFTLTDTIAVMQCRLAGKLVHGDHQVLLGEVVNAFTMNMDQEPFVHLRKSGFNY